MPAMTDRLVAHLTPRCPPSYFPSGRRAPLGSECPPGPIAAAGDWWPIIATLAAVSVAIALAFVLVLRPRDSQRSFEPHLGWLSLAGGAASLATILLVIWPRILGVPLFLAGNAASIATALLTGTSLRPRGSAARGVLLGATVYLLIGVAVVVIVNALLGASLEELAGSPLVLLQIPFWPGLILSYLSGHYGR